MCTTVFLSQTAIAQNLNFRLPITNTQVVNPAMIGLGHYDEYQADRIYSGIKAQWVGINKRLSTSSLTYDMANNSNSSFGVSLISTDFLSTRENQSTQYNHLGGQISYAYLIPGKKVNWKFGLSLQTSNYQFGNTNFIWADQVNSELTAFTNPTAEPVQNLSMYSIQLGSGALVFGKNWFAGISVHNINEPNIAFFENTKQPLYRRYMAQFGVKIQKAFSSTSFTPTFQYIKQFNTNVYAFDGVFQNGNVYYGLGNFSSEINGSFTHALHTFLAVRKNGWGLGYDLDLNVSVNQNSPMLTHEFNIIYLLRDKNNKRAVFTAMPLM